MNLSLYQSIKYKNKFMSDSNNIAIIGAGNIGSAIADGLVTSGIYRHKQIILTRRHEHSLTAFQNKGFNTTTDNRVATQRSSVIVVCVEPHQIDGVLQEIHEDIDPSHHLVISVASGVTLKQLSAFIPATTPLIRAMPNTAISIGESMTCLAADPQHHPALDQARNIFEPVGQVLVIDEEQMTPATALCACGIAFFLRSIRAASQGGIETGIDSATALKMAAQTAKGAAALLLEHGNHPEFEIDKVTTPRGCTIAGLNKMEHKGFSSAIIQGIAKSAEKAGELH